MTTKTKTKIIEKEIIPSDDDLFLGATKEVVKQKVVDYNNEKVLYRITNLEVKNEPTIFTGNFIDNFIGSCNLPAKKELQKGAKKVIILDKDTKKELYKIEVIE